MQKYSYISLKGRKKSQNLQKIAKNANPVGRSQKTHEFHPKNAKNTWFFFKSSQKYLSILSKDSKNIKFCQKIAKNGNFSIIAKTRIFCPNIAKIHKLCPKLAKNWIYCYRFLLLQKLILLFQNPSFAAQIMDFTAQKWNL